MKKYVVIGDIHCRDNWKRLILKDAVHVFVGDYFSPYDNFIPFKKRVERFKEIIQFKKDHPETILLVGNHDEDHWHICEGYSRQDAWNINKIRALFEENKDLFQAAYSIENKVLVTHAGVSAYWYARRALGKENGHLFIDDPERLKLTPDLVAEAVNKLWYEDPIKNFSFRGNSKMSDYNGISEMQSPMWIREAGLRDQNIFSGTSYIQVYGHTINDEIEHFSDSDNTNKGQRYMIDCLQYKTEALLIEYDDAGVQHISHLEGVEYPSDYQNEQ